MKMKLAVIVAATAAGAAVAQPAVQRDANPVLLLARQAHAEWEAAQKDQFAPSPSHAEMVGKAFTLIIQGRPVNPAFLEYYHDGKLKLSLVNKRYITVVQTPLSTSKHVAQNAFGATVEITSDIVEDLTLEAVDMPTGDPNFIAGVKFGDDQYDWEKALDGPEAKVIYEGAKLVLEGEIAARSDGKVTHCDAQTSLKATLDKPHEIFVKTCDVAVRLHRIAFVTGDGTTLKEWRK